MLAFMNVRTRAAWRRVVLALLFALLTTVLVSWGLACRGVAPGGTLRLEAHSQDTGPWLAIAERRGLGFARRCEMLFAPTGFGVNGGAFTFEIGPSPDPQYPLQLSAMQTLEQADPVLAAQVEKGAPGGPIAIWPLQDRFGWPCLSMAYWHRGVTGFADQARSVRGGVGIDFGVTLKPSSAPLALDAVALPYAPLWRGFIANCAVYAATCWMLLTMNAVYRDRRRRRLGQCLSCGYVLAGLPRCPECGVEGDSPRPQTPSASNESNVLA